MTGGTLPPFADRLRGLAVADPSLLALGAGAFLLRTLAVVAVGFNPGFFDVDGYHASALAGLNGLPIPTSHHPPGYSFVLFLFYSVAGIRPRLFLLVQALLGAIACVLVADAARRTMGAGAGRLAGGLLATNPYVLMATPALGSENLALPLVALVTWLVVRDLERPATRCLLAAALTVSAAGLVRSALVSLAAPLVLLAIFGQGRAKEARWRRILTGALLLILSVGAPVAFGLVRAQSTGVFRIGSPHDVYNLWVGNNPHATGRIEEMPDLPPASFDREAVARILGPRVRRFVLEQPFRQLDLVAKRLSYNLAPPKRDLIYLYGNGWAGERPASVVRVVYALVALSFPVLGALTLLAFARAGHIGAFQRTVGIALAVLLPYLVSIGDARFVLPAYPALCVACGALAAAGVPRPWSRGRRLGAALAAALFLGNAAMDVTMTDPALRAIERPGGSRLKPAYHLAR